MIFKRNLSTAAAATFWAMVSAGAHAQSYNDIETISLSKFTGTITIDVASERRVEVDANDGKNANYRYAINTESNVLTIASEKPATLNWNNSWRHFRGDPFERLLEDYPAITLTVPPGTNLIVDNSTIAISANGRLGNFETAAGYVDGTLRDVQSANIFVASSADLTVGDVAEGVEIKLKGSGDISVGDSDAVELYLKGSGDVQLGDIANDFNATVRGSGDISSGDIDGMTNVTIQGSGDIRTGNANAGAAIEIQGSGDVMMDAVTGPISISVNGSGDTDIDTGRADGFIAQVNGSGDIVYGGIAVNPELRANGSGSISVYRAEGDIDIRGDGDIRVGDKWYD